jgi:hypothetical protein
MKNNKLRIGIVADDITRAQLALECQLIGLTPLNYKFMLRFCRPDFLLVESAWNAQGGAWKYKIAAYPDVPKRNNHTLARMVAYARDLGIPTVFWSKEDHVHFDRFIASAKLFSVKPDWAANIVFASGALIVSGIGAMWLRSARILRARDGT